MNKTLQSFVKWSGSKRSQADKIIEYFPKKFDVYFEPFLGGGSIIGNLLPEKAICGDIYSPLIKLWKLIQKNPDTVAKKYKKEWLKLQKNGHEYYYKIRERYNRKQDPIDLMFLSRTCVNGMIRFNKNGKFNNSLHHSRKGMHPDRLEIIIYEWFKRIENYKFYCKDYTEIITLVNKNDFLYLDPPYLNTHNRYIQSLDFNQFSKFLYELNKKQIKFALSFDGVRGDKSFITDIPRKLYKRHIMIKSGNAPFRKLQDKKIELVQESLYLNY